MTTRYRIHKQTVRDALVAHGGKVVDLDGGRWELMAGHGSGQCVGVQLQNDWLSFTAPVPPAFGDGNREMYERYLSANPRLPGRCKVALYPCHTALCLREDIAIVDGVDLSSRCTEAIANLVAACAVLAKKPRAARMRKTTPLSSELTDVLKEVCGTSGWEYAGREDGSGVATLALPNGSVKATVTANGRRDFRIAAPLPGYESLADIGRRAAAVLLLTVNGLVRFARAGVERSAGRASVAIETSVSIETSAANNTSAANKASVVSEASAASAFIEIPFRGRPSAALLDTALSALAVSGGLCDRELSALADETVARCYLDARASSPAPALSSLAL